MYHDAFRNQGCDLAMGFTQEHHNATLENVAMKLQR